MSAQAATPKVSEYSLTGAFEVWIEPKPAGYPNEATWEGCVVKSPKLTFNAALAEKRNVTLQFRPYVTWRGGLSLPIAGINGFLTTTPWTPVEGPNDLDGLVPLGLYEGRTPPPFPSNAADRGRVTLTGQLVYPQRWNGINFPVFKALPTRSVPFTKLAKPAGACSAAGPGASTSLVIY